MKRAWYIFKEYYLVYIIISMIILTLAYFLDDTLNDILSLKLLLIVFGAWILIIGTIEYLKENYYKPWKKNKILIKSPFVEFINKGFVRKGDKYIGQYKNHTLLIGLEWEFHQKRPNYYFQVLFNPFVNGRLLRQNECVKFDGELEENKKHFTLNSIVKQYGQRKIFLRTEYKDIIKDINITIDFLRVRKLESISFDEWVSYIPKVKKHAEKFVY